MKERKLRLEVGRGLEKVVNDEEAATILDDRVAPAMRAGYVIRAVTAGVDGVVAQLTRGPDRRTPAAPVATEPVKTKDSGAPRQSFVEAPEGSDEPSDPTVLVVGGLILGGSVVIAAATMNTRGGGRRTSGGRWQDHSWSGSHSSSSGSSGGSDSGGSSDGGGASGGW